MDSQESVMEGFLCPICIADLKSPAELSAHFEIAHADDKVVYQQLKSVFSKAKRKILKDSDTVNNNNNDVSKTTDVSSSSKVNISNGKPSTGGIDLSLWEKQTVGKPAMLLDKCLLEILRICLFHFRLHQNLKFANYVKHFKAFFYEKHNGSS